ncbi:MAG TPA: cytochrome c3 family protein [Candidatus Binatia bacterium]|nr:cytochrome c3 family protein [Candidatus Binatia bacterium]
MRERITTWLKRAAVALVVLIPGGAAFTFLAVEVTSQPRFCGTCHNMRPYYESWKTSTHNQIACVECHIPPGIESEVRKKYEALSMVARYFTGTYSTNPWTEVDDKSCLRSGCHVKRVLLGREVYKGVLFDHQPHLTELRRQKQLRCTSCHSQIVQGSHIAVTASTCFLCHFKGVTLNTETARCTLCHAIPEKTITTAGLSFNHADVKRYGMNCMSCHEGVVKGEGEVPRERCFTCHNDTARLNRYGETEFLHRTHVTDHKVECLNCHIEIRHKIPAREEALATECRSCHSSGAGHAGVRELYRGIGGQGVQPQPAPMYLAGIRCEACHNRQQGDTATADEVSCMKCHGPAYLTIYRGWKTGLQYRFDGVRAELKAATDALSGVDGDAASNLAAARQNIAFLEAGKPIHNPSYAVSLIEKSHQDIVAALAAAGRQPLARPWMEAPYQIACLKCHFGIEYQSGPAFDRQFAHQPHIMTARLRCTSCHGDQDHHGTMKLTASDCTTCHERTKRSMAGVTSEQCLTCHTADLGTVSDQVTFPHEKHIAAGLDCEMCHQGVADKPHREFARSATAVPKFGHEFCSTCHGSDVLAADGSMPDGANCAMCHTSS